MKKIVAFFTVMMFALTLGTAFAAENASTATEKAPVASEKTPAKAKKGKTKHVKKHKHEAAAPAEAAPATK